MKSFFVHRNENSVNIVCVNKEFKGTSKLELLLQRIFMELKQISVCSLELWRIITSWF